MPPCAMSIFMFNINYLINYVGRCRNTCLRSRLASFSLRVVIGFVSLSLFKPPYNLPCSPDFSPGLLPSPESPPLLRIFTGDGYQELCTRKEVRFPRTSSLLVFLRLSKAMRKLTRKKFALSSCIIWNITDAQ